MGTISNISIKVFAGQGALNRDFCLWGKVLAGIIAGDCILYDERSGAKMLQLLVRQPIRTQYRRI